MKTIKIPRPDNYRVSVAEGKCLSVSCEYEGYKYTYTLGTPLSQKQVNKIYADLNDEEQPPTPQQYCANCLSAAFFGASKTHHIKNIMDGFMKSVGKLEFEELKQQ